MEIHHRVKNNLQVICSLLTMQARGLEGNNLSQGILEASINRVRAIAMVHERLYQQARLSSIELGDYLRDLVNQIFETFDIDRNKIEISVEGDPCVVPMDDAVPLALILNELVTNSVLHAFPQRNGKLSIRLRNHSNSMVLEVSDDGIGMKHDLTSDGNSKSLGLKLVHILAKQLDAIIEKMDGAGTTYRITFHQECQSHRGGEELQPDPISLLNA